MPRAAARTCHTLACALWLLCAGMESARGSLWGTDPCSPRGYLLRRKAETTPWAEDALREAGVMHPPCLTPPYPHARIVITQCRQHAPHHAGRLRHGCHDQGDGGEPASCLRLGRPLDAQLRGWGFMVQWPHVKAAFWCTDAGRVTSTTILATARMLWGDGALHQG